MGNCQAAEAAAVVIQHPGGKVERLYGAATADEVMRGNPGHYVALVVLRVSGVGTGGGKADPAAAGGAKITKVKLLKPKDTLLLGQVYRLVTSQEVAKAIQARREDKMRRYGGGGGAGEVVVDDDDDRRAPGRHAATAAAAGSQGQGRRSTSEQERKRPEKSDRQHRTSGGGAGGGRGRHWQPSLQSISEAAS